MHPKYPNVFNPIKLGPVEIDNRFYFAPHGVNMALPLTNEPGTDFPYYSAARAKGGAGLVIQALSVHGKKTGSCSPYPEENVESFRALADSIHREGGKVFGQLWYFWGAPGEWGPLAPPRPSLTPTSLQLGGNYFSSHGMRREELRAFVDAYRRSTTNLRRAGYDGVELHVTHGTLLEQSISPYFNRRTDEYGGSPENRLRLVFECLQAVREAAGDEMAVGIRFNCDEMLPGGYGQPEARAILGEICKSGLVDFVDLDVAVEPLQFSLGMPSVFIDKYPYKPFVEAVRSAAGDIPVLSVLGRLTSVAEAEEAIESGLCDMVGAARALIAEPNLVRNAREGQEELSRTCITCNYCLEMGHAGALGCSINPASFRERLWGEQTLEEITATRSKVVVVGGGPGGLEAARVAAIKGHDVVLLESRGDLGGGLRVWATLPGREWFHKGVEWYEREMKRLGIDVRLNTVATPELILAEEPDAVIVATGSLYSKTGRSGMINQPIDGHDREFVLRPEDILVDGVMPTGKVVIIDGEGIHTGVGIAEILAASGADVEIVSSGFAPLAPNLFATTEGGFIIGRLNEAGVTVTSKSWVKSIGDGTVTLFDVFTKEERTITDVSTVVMAVSREPQDQLAEALTDRVAQLFTVGDALAARPMGSATYEGQMFARFIGEPGAPTTFNEAYWPDIDRSTFAQPASTMLAEATA